ncbi:MAG TPA: cold shock domain-containing protein, partial [Candidatus Nanoarchaeia archaeon]|nr:cold shock domain-containing protein [Candidatus Nanoarchaeia archaeon]
FNASKGYGFVACDDDGKEYFVHQSGLNEGVVIKENDLVTFDVVSGDRGPKAVHVALASGNSDEE